MKKLVFGLIAIVVCANFTFAQKRLTSKDLEFVGIQHNEYLQSFYEKVVNEKLTSRDKDIAINFLVSQVTKTSQTDEEAKMASENIINKFKERFTTEDPHLDVVFPNLPIVIKNYLKSLDRIIYANISNITEYQNQIVALENTINRDTSLGNKELLVLYTATNVAKYSGAYWDKNRDNWILAGNTNSTVMQKMGPGGRIGGMDVAGGVGAAAGTWAVNAIPGAGQVAYGSAIVGGAVAGSVGQAAYELWSWAFGD